MTVGFFHYFFIFCHIFSDFNCNISNSSLPFPVEGGEEGEGDGDGRDPGHRGPGKGLTREQKSGLEMVKHIMLSLDEEDGLDQIYTFGFKDFFFFLPVFQIKYFSLCIVSFFFPPATYPLNSIRI